MKWTIADTAMFTIGAIAGGVIGLMALVMALVFFSSIFPISRLWAICLFSVCTFCGGVVFRSWVRHRAKRYSE